MPPDDHQGRNYLVWCFPCRCHMRMHLSCMLQMRMRCPSPACMRCRDPWPGDSADIALFQACQEANLPIVSWGGVCPFKVNMIPLQGCRPDRNAFLFFAVRLLAEAPCMLVKWNGLRCAPFRSTRKASGRKQGGKENGGCNICGRTILHDEVEARAHTDTSEPGPVCPCDGARTLVVDLAFGSSTWVCLPGCTSSVDACAAVSCAAAAATTAVETLPISADAPVLMFDRERPRSNTFFSAAPPVQNHDATNSFVYCPILLHTAGLLLPEAASSWSSVVPWFEPLCLAPPPSGHKGTHGKGKDRRKKPKGKGEGKPVAMDRVAEVAAKAAVAAVRAMPS